MIFIQGMYLSSRLAHALHFANSEVRDLRRMPSWIRGKHVHGQNSNMDGKVLQAHSYRPKCLNYE